MISFVIPAYNEERTVGRAIEAVHAACAVLEVPYEVIVADDASTDRTAEIARNRGARVVEVANRQIAATRNAGAAVATGDALIFVDADTLVSEAVVGAALRALEEGAVGGGAAARFDGRVPFYAKVMVGMLVLSFRVLRLAAGCFLFCRTAAFRAVGGFDERLYGAEEVALSLALRRQGRFVVLREAVVTSGRKVRAHSGWELTRTLIRAFGRLVLRGPRRGLSRESFDIWYDARRPDPEPPDERLAGAP